MKTHDVTVRDVQVLRGPNLHAYMPVLKITLDIGSYEERGSDSFPGFVERLVAWLPGLEKHECSVGRPGGFIERLRRGTYLAHICEHVTLELQGLMGFPVAFGRARGTGERGVYTVVIQYRVEEPARAAFETALRLTLAAMHDEPFDMAAELEQLLELADEYRLGPSTAAIVEAARARKIPVLRVTPNGSLIQLGYGMYQKRILASQTSYTSAIAVDVCQDKLLTNDLLRRVGVPVPEGRVVTSAKDAWNAAQEIGLPVVVKPADGRQGKGVSIHLTQKEVVRSAFTIARKFGRQVQVERFIHGRDFRLLVVNGKLVAAARRDPAQVVGDGKQTVTELIHALNQDPRRRPGHGSVLTRVEANEEVKLTLAQQEMTLETVPTTGQTVWLRNNCNLSTGGTATDVTDEVHPSNVRLAELVAQIIALDVAGIDVVCQDISRPLREQDGAIVEVNAAPGLRMHLNPSQGQPRQVGAPIVDMLYPPDAPTRIPIIAITGTNGKTTVTRLLNHMYSTAHWVVGMTCTDGVYINNSPILRGDCSGPKSAQAVLLHPQVEVAVLETARGGILREGLAFDQCSVGVVTNVSADHLGLGGINTLEELAGVKQVVVEAVSPGGAAVLNAEDPLVAEMAAATDAAVIYFCRDANNHVMAAHLAEGESGLFVEDGMIILATGDERVPLVELERLHFTLEGRLGFQVMNALAATAAAWAAGLNPAMIVRALTTFETSVQIVPGRFNLFKLNGVEVILDYGHNAAALKALGEAVQAMDKRRTVMAMTLPGDRRDEDLVESVKATLPFVDAYVVYDSVDLRGRKPDEVPQLICSQLPAAVPCEVVAGQPEGIAAAWRQVQNGHRLVIIADEVDEALEVLHSLARSMGEDAACSYPIVHDEEDVHGESTTPLPPLSVPILSNGKQSH
jgi:cyanophycin synthetase